MSARVTRRHAASRDALEGAITAIARGGLRDAAAGRRSAARARARRRARAAADRPRRCASQGRAVRAFQDAVRRRAVEREPVAYIVGRRGFRRLELAVDRRALIPRPETELLVECGARAAGGRARARRRHRQRRGRAGAASTSAPTSTSGGSDVSEGALELARANARAAGPGGALAARRPARTACPTSFDAVLANPPYVAESRARARSRPRSSATSPPGALFAGAGRARRDRAAASRQLARARARRGCVALEVGAGQAEAVAELMRDAGFERLALRAWTSRGSSGW